MASMSSSTMPSPTGSNQTRILVLIKGLGIGGAERLISEGARFWDRDRFDYQVAYVLPWKDQLVDDLEALDVPVTLVGGDKGLDLQTPFRFRRLVDEWMPDIVHSHLPSAGILSRVATSTPTVYTEHNIAHSYRQPTRALNHMTYRRNARVIAVSAAVGESLDGYPGPKPTVIPNGVAPKAARNASSVRDELGIDESVPLVVHVGNIRPHKGHQNLIEATAELAVQVPTVAVVSIGVEKEDGDLVRLRSEAAKHGVEGHIRFMGRRPDALDFIAAADVVANPSDFEGLPVTLLEALAFSRPVVATDVGGVSSLIDNELTGLLVPAKDPAALAKGIERALRTDDAADWGRRGAERVESRHSMARMIESYEDVYRELINGG
jgi:glycosyltransferase involved in cell wall biosynthesis